MSIDKRNQCKSTHGDYLLRQSRFLLAKLTPEARQSLSEQIQTRISLLGEQPANKVLYKQVMNKLNGGNGNGKCKASL